MDDPITFDSIDVTMSGDLQHSGGSRPKEETPFKILIMGNFSGRSDDPPEFERTDIHERRLHRVDRDNDDDVMARIGVSITIAVESEKSPPIELEFDELDDFHPEQIYHRTPIFKTLRDTRRKLVSPDTFAEAAAMISGIAYQPDDHGRSSENQSRMDQESSVSKETSSGLLDQILEADAPPRGRSHTPQSETQWDRFLADITAPYLVPDCEHEQDSLVGVVDRSIAGLMNSILHHPDFQALESTWRALRFVLRRLETGMRLHVDLLDITKAELAADLTGSENLKDTALYKKLSAASQENAGQTPWAVLAGLYTFDKTKSDGIILAQAGALGQLLGAPFVGEGAGSVIGCQSIAATPDPSEWTVEASPEDENAWQVIRSLPEACWVGLALPRFMVRLPYGKNTDPVDVFDLEEMAPEPVHEHYLWASPVFAAILVLGRSFIRYGWDFANGIENTVEGLPLHTYTDHDETVTKPCAEVCLTDWAMAKTADCGIMALMSFKDQDRVMLSRLQAIASSPAPLSGRWFESS